MPERFAVGVDFGGTKILAGVVNLDTGRLVSASKAKTGAPSENGEVIKRITSAIDLALVEARLEAKQVQGIGVGAAGQVNRQKGVLVNAANIGVTDLPVCQPLSNQYKVDCVIGNDVEAATMGELKFGAGRKSDSFVCIFVGTGIGSGIVNDGKLYRGHTGTAGEIGHIVFEPYGRICGCGALGCLEAYASRTAVAKHIVAELSRGADSTVRDKINMNKGILRSKAIAEAVAEGDDLTIAAIKQAAEFMGLGLASVINFYNPQRIIMGGGLIEACDLYFEIASKRAKQHALRHPAKKVEIVKAELGDYAGVIGSALLVREN